MAVAGPQLRIVVDHRFVGRAVSVVDGTVGVDQVKVWLMVEFELKIEQAVVVALNNSEPFVDMAELENGVDVQLLVDSVKMDLSIMVDLLPLQLILAFVSLIVVYVGDPVELEHLDERKLAETVVGDVAV